LKNNKKEVFIIKRLFRDMGPDALREAADLAKRKYKTAVVILGDISDSRPSVLVALSGDLKKAGLDARKLVRPATDMIKGGGGGREDFVQAGGREADRLSDALEAVRDLADEEVRRCEL